MKNIDIKTDGNMMTLVVDTSKDFGPSKSGKTTIIASSEGNQKVGDVVVGLNVYRKR